MSRRPVLTKDQITYIQRVADIRRRIVARLRKLPTNAKLAEDFHCSQRVVDKYSTETPIESAATSYVPCGTHSDERLRARITDEEFAQLMRVE